MVPKVWTFEYFVELYLYCRKDAKKKLHNCQNFMIFWNRKEKKNSRDARLICWFLHSLIEINRWILNIRRASRKGLNDWVIEDRLAKFKTRTWIFIASPFLISTESAWYPRPCSLNTHSAWNACIYPILHVLCLDPAQQRILFVRVRLPTHFFVSYVMYPFLPSAPGVKWSYLFSSSNASINSHLRLSLPWDVNVQVFVSRLLVLDVGKKRKQKLQKIATTAS